ncbi:TetR/AcrR family transcriptional regulator [Candidatus Phycosocius spiralis]|uniref:TetR family transcriptional regulator n=1 Tax=Candidatus Phycosocius spiralis TaxID=2815099 RepID=A0ABQ4PXT5_9PROT|nr:TetR/AcrR family transcriptional regulator [Candidatus Phycosocius spiralis]GIU67886.1 TetR family transcriptional regulator [Candidatus Phycosocius spiralis]
MISNPDNSALPRWTRKPKARPDEVLEAALELFALNGFAATRMEDIAQRAGLSKAAIYLYFPSKHDVFKALVEQRVGVLRTHFDAAARQQLSDPKAGLRLIAHMWATSFHDLRVAAIPRIILAEAHRFPDLAEFYHRTVIERTQAALVELIQAGIDRGQFRTVEPIIAARALVSPLVFEILRRQAFPQFHKGPSMDQEVEAIFDLFLNGIAATPHQTCPE